MTDREQMRERADSLVRSIDCLGFASTSGALHWIATRSWWRDDIGEEYDITDSHAQELEELAKKLTGKG